MPILAATDPNTDIGKIAVDNHYGFYCESNNIINFNKIINYCIQNKNELEIMGENGYKFLKDKYTVENSYEMIIKHIN